MTEDAPGKPRVGRLAPSPTGRLHLGHARTFLIAYWHARAGDGRLALRMEDLDVPRVVPGATDEILRDIDWLGLDWDGPVLVQSSRLDAITARVDELVARGLAYPCTCSRGDIRSAQSAPQQGTEEPRYPGTCRGRYESVADAERRSGRSAGIRFLVPEGPIRFVDGVVGAQESDVAAEVGDFLIARRGGAPAYQIAVVVDDAAQGVTDVIRGDDLLPSTARQFLLQSALGLPHPAWWHVPLVQDETGRRLAKRSDAVSLSELRAKGVDPRAIVGWSAATCGMNVPERLSAREGIAAFSIGRIPRSPVRIDLATLDRILASS